MLVCPNGPLLIQVGVPASVFRTLTVVPPPPEFTSTEENDNWSQSVVTPLMVTATSGKPRKEVVSRVTVLPAGALTNRTPGDEMPLAITCRMLTLGVPAGSVKSVVSGVLPVATPVLLQLDVCA